MTGLVMKDILAMRKTLKTYALFLCLYLLLAVLGAFERSFVSAMISIIVMMLPIGAFSYDEAAKWDRFAMSLPLFRRSVVGARYLFVLLMALMAASFGLLASLFVSLTGDTVLTQALATILVSLGTGLLIADILLPLSYKLRPERARPYLYLVVFTPLILLFGGYKLDFLNSSTLGWLDRLSDAGILGLLSLVPLTALAGLLLSFLISCRIVERKEF